MNKIVTVGVVLPPLFGDGVHDDTAAIQARLDGGKGLVYLPPPAKEYLISKALLLSSNCELRLDRNTVVRLAPGSRCSMVENRHYETGDRNLAYASSRPVRRSAASPSATCTSRRTATPWRSRISSPTARRAATSTRS